MAIKKRCQYHAAEETKGLIPLQTARDMATPYFQ